MTDRPTIVYQPALDGVRALAVAAVLLFHGGVPGFDGGYLGVSVFFTLSGFLITSLLVHEHDASGRIDLATFYGRRLRRLLPASLLCISAIVVFAALTDVFEAVTSLRAHVLGSVLQVANWVFLAGEGSYQDLLARASGTSSPLEHFWSLAIEEQFYWFWPPVMLLVLSRATRQSGRLVAVGILTTMFLIAAPVIASVWGPDAAYWATPARIGEILVGAFLAVLLTSWKVGARWGMLAVPALVVLAAAVVLFPSSSGPAYEGALPLVALVSGALLLGLQVDGPLRQVLSLEPLVHLGRISYGVYLFHWPVYVLLDSERTGLDGPVLLGVRLTVTLLISVVSYKLMELPVRVGGWGLRLTFVSAATGTAAMVVLALVAVPTGLGDYWVASDDATEAASIDTGRGQSDAPLVVATTIVPAPDPADATSTTTSTITTPTTAASAPVPTSSSTSVPELLVPASLPELGRPVRILITGDSTSGAVGAGVVEWAAANPEIAQAEIANAPGCGFLTGGEQQIGDTIGVVEGCDDWVDRFVLPAVVRTQPDVVMVMVTSWDIVDRRWDTEQLLDPTHPDYRARLDHDYARLVSDLLASGAGSVALIDHPIPDTWWLPEIAPEESPERHMVIYEMYDELATPVPDVATIPLDKWFTQNDLDDDEDVRPDGVHVTPEASFVIATDFLGPALAQIALGGLS